MTMDCFNQNIKNPKELSPLVLAYIGDAVFEMFVRTKVLNDFGNSPVSKMNSRSREMVRAKGQSDFYYKIENMLNDEEAAVFKRGRNAKSHTMPKNADLMEYKCATGLEAVFGYLYLNGNLERLKELFMAGTDKKEKLFWKEEN